jgi:very-short-patch-repair endonuclease
VANSIHCIVGVYAVGHRVVGIEGRWLAAVLASGQGAVLSHRSAGQLWGLLQRSGGEIETTRARGWRSPTGVLAHCGSLPADEVTNNKGIPITSPFRTLFDLAAVLSERQLEKALNETEVRGFTDLVSLPALLDRYPRRRGVANLRSLLDASAPQGITRSELEDRFVTLVDTHGLPRPRLNTHVAVESRFFEVDCLWPDQRLVVELDGRSAHGTGRAFERDRERDRLLTVEGYRVVRFTWRQLREDAPAVAADLRRLLSDEATPAYSVADGSRAS